MKRRGAPHSDRPRANDAGITLLELVVSIALFSMVALIGLQALRMSLLYQERLVQVSAQTAQLDAALSLIRHDLEAALSLAPDQPIGPTELPLHLVGLPSLASPAQSTSLNVLWRYDPQRRTLVRERLETPQDSQTVLSKISSLQFAVLGDEGWVSPVKTIDQPRGYEMRAQTGQGPLRILVVK